MNKFKYILLFCLISTFVSAAPTCVVKGGGIFDNLLLQFGNLTQTWQGTIEPLAKKFFYILFGMEFMWQITVKKVFAGDIEKLWVFFFTRTVLCFFFGQYLVNLAMYKGIIDFLSGLGSSIGGISLNMQPGSGVSTISPSAVVSTFSCVADMVHTVTDQTGAFDYITIKITLAMMQVILFLVLISIAYYLIQVILQAYLIIYIGFLFAGFAGSSWTMNYWQTYLSATISVGSKFLVVCVIMGVLNAQMQNWAVEINQAAQGNSIVLIASLIPQVIATAIIIALAIWKLPEWFAGVTTGQIVSDIKKPENGASTYLSATQSVINGISGIGGKSSPTLGMGNLDKKTGNNSINPFGKS